MAKCPKCNDEIDSLNAYSIEMNKQKVTVDESFPNVHATLDWGRTEVVECSCTKIDFECPNCDATLFTTKGDSQPKEVIEFLKGAKVEQA